MDIGLRLRNLRESVGLTQEEVGRRIGVTKATVNRYETGEIDIKRTVAIKLADVLNSTPSYIMGWINIPNNTSSATAKDEEEIIYSYRQLNDAGKSVAKAYINDLLEISKYTTNQDNDYSDVIPIAARSGVSAVVKPSHSKEERNAALDEELPGVSTPITPPEF